MVGACGEYTPDFKSGEKVKSPGVLYKHYSPRCQTALYTFEELNAALAACQTAIAEGKRVAVLAEGSVLSPFERAGAKLLNLGNTETEMASRLYELLREAEKLCDILIAVEPMKKDGVMVGVLNRLRKACISADINH